MKNKILIIEDDTDLRELLDEIFTDEGFETVMAADGCAAGIRAACNRVRA